jgi:predicted alpha/beta-hydrolase family hydrolase
MWELVDKLGPWPLIQIAFVALIMLYGIRQYLTMPTASVAPPHQEKTSGHQGDANPEVSLMYFQGWFSELQKIRVNQELARMQAREDLAVALRETRHDLKNSMTVLQAEFKEELETTAKQIKEHIDVAKAEVIETRITRRRDG